MRLTHAPLRCVRARKRACANRRFAASSFYSSFSAPHPSPFYTCAQEARAFLLQELVAGEESGQNPLPEHIRASLEEFLLLEPLPARVQLPSPPPPPSAASDLPFPAPASPPASLLTMALDLGYACTASPQALREALSAVGRGHAARAYGMAYGLTPLTEPEVARLLVACGNSLNISALAGHEGGAAPPSVNPAAALGPVFDALAGAVGRPPPFTGGRVVQSALPLGVGNTWRHDVIAAVLREDAPNLDWARVIGALDFPECSLAQPHAFQFVVAVARLCSSAPFPTAELLRAPWANARAHVDALKHACLAPPDAISFACAPPVGGGAAPRRD